MYIECKGGNLSGPARIGRVTFSKTGRTLYYQKLSFQRVQGFKHNYQCLETEEAYWISGAKRDGTDALYATNVPIDIDEDVREEYWKEIRGQPERVSDSET